MAKLFQITAIKHEQYNYNPVTTMYLNAKNVVSAPSVAFVDNSGVDQVGTLITYNIAGKTKAHEIIATEPPSTIFTRINAATTTDVHQLNVTEIGLGAPLSGYIPPTFLTSRALNVDDIWMLQPHPLNNSNAMVVVENQVRTTQQTIRTANTAASIVTAANS
jgi:hypothetical protein